MTNSLYSIVVPAYNEEEVIKESYLRLTKVMKLTNENYEIIFINDGSKDHTEYILKELCTIDAKVKLVNFSRNFGHQNAVTAGINYSSGDAIIIIDADLQDPPELIPEMIEKYKEGFDVVYGVREQRKGETAFKKATAAIFYRFLNKMTDTTAIPNDTGDFRLISRNICNSLKDIKESNRFLRGLTSWVGFNQIGIKYVRNQRFAGQTKYPLKKMIKFSLDAITSFSTKPLKISSYLGFIFSFAGFIYAIYAVIMNIFYNATLQGWTTLVVLICIIGGSNLIVLGIIGEYIARIYDETKKRPLYIVKETLNFNQSLEFKEAIMDEELNKQFWWYCNKL